jgi:hypothetical protein
VVLYLQDKNMATKNEKDAARRRVKKAGKEAGAPSKSGKDAGASNKVQSSRNKRTAVEPKKQSIAEGRK